MSLFDVLKYPNVDILDEDMLRTLPRPLLETWARELINEYNLDLDLTDESYIFSETPRMAAHRYLWDYSPFLSRSSRYTIIDFLYEKFRKRLKEMIAEYEPE